MPKSLNGWPVLTPGSKLLCTKQIPTVDRRLTMRCSVIRIFLALANDYDDWVKTLDNDKKPVDDGAYNYRPARNANAWSNHASGTAIDLNWSQEGAQSSSAGAKFFAKPENKAKIEWLKTVYPILVWGGDWRAKDYMHWELAPGTTQADVDRLIKKLGIDENGIRHNGPDGKPLRKPRR